AVADHVEVGAVAQRKAQRVQHDGLAGPGFAGDGGHAVLEFKFELVDEGEVLDGELRKHGVAVCWLRPHCSTEICPCWAPRQPCCGPLESRVSAPISAGSIPFSF